ncbi:hypothetical protein SAMN05216551_101498 [Chitinasiproducens palmae]|uniref:Uncharacterized protein n=1 Tax=Chitinasiproducens palmae TaxID=1770053 RepID=A0A1H2PJV6_9BURK|nr:hypothetical protein SAMN05216551_101498 [Chitinasiproducens palmae]
MGGWAGIGPGNARSMRSYGCTHRVLSLPGAVRRSGPNGLAVPVPEAVGGGRKAVRGSSRRPKQAARRGAILEHARTRPRTLKQADRSANNQDGHRRRAGLRRRGVIRSPLQSGLSPSWRGRGKRCRRRRRPMAPWPGRSLIAQGCRDGPLRVRPAGRTRTSAIARIAGKSAVCSFDRALTLAAIIRSAARGFLPVADGA